jgi:hypothetical protein
VEFRRIDSREPAAPAGELSVMLEPLPGHSDDEVVARLEDLGASKVSVLAPGFISAHALADALDAVQEIADVHVKALKQIRIG